MTPRSAADLGLRGAVRRIRQTSTATTCSGRMCATEAILEFDRDGALLGTDPPFWSFVEAGSEPLLFDEGAEVERDGAGRITRVVPRASGHWSSERPIPRVLVPLAVLAARLSLRPWLAFQSARQGKWSNAIGILAFRVPQFEIRFTYDADGRKSEERLIAFGLADWRTIYEYDTRGRLTSKTDLEPDGDACAGERHEYEFDDAGNWVHRVSSRWMRIAPDSTGDPGDVEHTTRREIEYYGSAD